MYGMHVHDAVLDSGTRVTGVTVHIVDEEYDRGPIIAQLVVPVLDGDTAETIQQRVLKREYEIYPRVIQWFSEGRIRIEDGRVFGGEPDPLLIEERSRKR